MKITVELVQSWEPCDDYSAERLRELLGDGLSPLEVAELDIPVEDRIWALLRLEVLGDGLRRVMDVIIERAIRRSLGKSGVPEWERWAERWLSGEDRTAEAAWDAENAARYVADAAADAADAAEAAAEAAALHAAARAADAAAWDTVDVGDALDTAGAAELANAVERAAQLADIVAELRRQV